MLLDKPVATELDEKTKAMLKLIEPDADSFAQRAEMYYKKRPELISMVEDFYRTHRSLAERYDLVTSDTGTRLPTAVGLQLVSVKHRENKAMSATDRTFYSSYQGTSDAEDYPESEVDDPVQEHELSSGKRTGEVTGSDLENEPEVEDPEPELFDYKPKDKVAEWDGDEESVGSDIEEAVDPRLDYEAQVGEDDSILGDVCDDEIMKLKEKEDSVGSEVDSENLKKLREEIEKLKEENMMQRSQLMQKDEEKREVIRQLSMAVELLQDENAKLRKYISQESPKKQSPFDLKKVKAFFMGSSY